MEILKNVKLLRDHIMLKYGVDKYNTAKNYCGALEKFLIYFKDYPEPKAINDEKIVEYLLQIPGRSNRCTHHSAIKKFFYLKGQPHKFRFIPYPEKEDKLPIHVNKEEFMQMVNVCDNEKHLIIISVLFDCGIRVSELINLQLQDIDRSNMLLNIIQGKGRKDRKVKLTAYLLGLIDNYISNYNPQIWLLNGQKPKGTTEIRPYTIKSCQEVVHQLTAKAGIAKHFSPHKFRHGFAMTHLENGETLSSIGNQLGHHSEKTTAIYARMNNKIIQKMESPLEQIMKEYALKELTTSPFQKKIA